MIVWVVENGVYSSRYIEGVYDSIEAVIAHHPVPDPPPPTTLGSSSLLRPGGWQPEDAGKPDGPWTNGLDWSYLLRAEPIEVQTMPPGRCNP